MNKKRVHRLYKLEGLCVGRHKPRRHRSAMTRPEGTKATRVNESVHSAVKRISGSTLRSRKQNTMFAEAAPKVVAYAVKV